MTTPDQGIGRGFPRVATLGREGLFNTSSNKDLKLEIASERYPDGLIRSIDSKLHADNIGVGFSALIRFRNSGDFNQDALNRLAVKLDGSNNKWSINVKNVNYFLTSVQEEDLYGNLQQSLLLTTGEVKDDPFVATARRNFSYAVDFTLQSVATLKAFNEKIDGFSFVLDAVLDAFDIKSTINNQILLGTKSDRNLELINRGLLIPKLNLQDPRPSALEIQAAIGVAKVGGWELFAQRQLNRNYEELFSTVRFAIKERYGDRAEELLAKARDVVRYFPALHIMDRENDPDFVAHFKLNVVNNAIKAASLREGYVRSGRNEDALGLTDYAFCSMPNWLGAGGMPIYFNLQELLQTDNSVVTLMDFGRMSFPNSISFADRVAFYQRSAVSGGQFLELLPYYLVAFYGDLGQGNYSKPSSGSADDFFPQWYSGDLLDQSIPYMEVKVPRGLSLANARFAIKGSDKHEGISEILNFLSLQGRSSQVVDYPNYKIADILAAGKDWWGSN